MGARRSCGQFRYEPFGIFPVFSYRIPKGNSVGKFGIIKLAGASYTHMVTTHRRLLRARILPLALLQCGGGGFSSWEKRGQQQQTTTTYKIRPGSRDTIEFSPSFAVWGGRLLLVRGNQGALSEHIRILPLFCGGWRLQLVSSLSLSLSLFSLSLSSLSLSSQRT